MTRLLKLQKKINSGDGVEAPSDWTTYEVIFPELKENSEDNKVQIKGLNLINFLESTPKETKLWSPLWDDLYLAEVDKENGIIFCYKNRLSVGASRCSLSQEDSDNIVSFWSDGTCGNYNYNSTQICMLFPSKYNLDWNIYKTKKL